MDITDHGGNSLLHTLLTENQRARHAENLIRCMLELLDPECRKNLFTQRNSYTNGAATPLHHWLKHTRALWGRDDNADKQEATLKMLLSYSNGEELGMVDGTGETPLHTLVTMNKPHLMRILLDHDPMLLYRENATGRTPAEVAYDSYMAPKLQPENQVAKTWRTWPQSIVMKRPEEFVKNDGKSKESLPWNVCKEYM
jgi:ankyrin repeat protein